jgi:hypothetical protein
MAFLHRTVLLVFAMATAAVPVGTARAAFEAPVELGQGSYRAAGGSATDGAGKTTAILAGVKRGPRMVQRASPTVPTAPSQPLPGAELGRAVGPTVAAAGQGALAVAWRIDTPKRYGAIAVAVADPDGTLGAPVVVSDRRANGVRYPALAIDGTGRAVLAYNMGTRAVHLSLKGAIAISMRGAGKPFGTRTVLDRHASQRPAVAVGDDGRGIVAWARDRRVWAAPFDAGAGTVGKVVALTGAGPHNSVVAAAGPDGAATVAWVTRREVGSGTKQATRYAVQAVHRADGESRFPKTPLTIAPADRPGYTTTVAIAADEDGTTTVAWTQRILGNDRNAGISGITASVQSATIGSAQKRFRPTILHMPAGSQDCETPAIAARAGRTVLAWSCNDRRLGTVYTRSTTDGAATKATPLLTHRLNSRTISQSTPVDVSLDAAGTSTILTTTSEITDLTKPEVRRVLAITGR